MGEGATAGLTGMRLGGDRFRAGLKGELSARCFPFFVRGRSQGEQSHPKHSGTRTQRDPPLGSPCVPESGGWCGELACENRTRRTSSGARLPTPHAVTTSTVQTLVQKEGPFHLKGPPAAGCRGTSWPTRSPREESSRSGEGGHTMLGWGHCHYKQKRKGLPSAPTSTSVGEKDEGRWREKPSSARPPPAPPPLLALTGNPFLHAG